MPQEADYNSYNYPNDMFHWVANLYKQKQNMKINLHILHLIFINFILK